MGKQGGADPRGLSDQAAGLGGQEGAPEEAGQGVRLVRAVTQEGRGWYITPSQAPGDKQGASQKALLSPAEGSSF